MRGRRWLTVGCGLIVGKESQKKHRESISKQFRSYSGHIQVLIIES